MCRLTGAGRPIADVLALVHFKDLFEKQGSYLGTLFPSSRLAAPAMPASRPLASV